MSKSILLRWFWVGMMGVLMGGSVLPCVAEDGSGAEVWRGTGEANSWARPLDAALPTAVDLRVRLAASGKPMSIAVHGGEDAASPGLVRIELRRDKEGRLLDAVPSVYADGWQAGERVQLQYWPIERNKKGVSRLEEDGISQRSWVDASIPVRIELQATAVRAWVQGKLVVNAASTVDAAKSLHVIASDGDVIESVDVQALRGGWRYQPIDLTATANEAVEASAVRVAADSAGVPFVLTSKGEQWLNLKNAKWVDGVRNPSSYYEQYDSGPYFLGDDRMPMIQLPRGDYVAAHILATADSDVELANQLTLRVGRYNQSYRGQVLRYDFAGDVPRGAGDADSLQAVRIPMTRAFAQDILDGVMDVELTKQVRLVRRTPDPNRYRWRPIGLPSGVRIAAITFERSPLQMKVTSEESGHLFVQPQQPTFSVSLENITSEVQPYTLHATARHIHGEQTTAQAAGQVKPGQTVQVQLPITADLRGYYDLSIELAGQGDTVLLQRQTTFAVLPKVQRPYHDESPIGVWDFTGGHLTPEDPEFVGPMYQKLGIRYGMFHHKVEDRQRFGVVKGNEASMRSNTKMDALLDTYKTRAEQHPDQLKSFLLFHEDSISGPHVTRTPDLFHDRPPYKLDEDEQKRFDQMFLLAKTAAQEMRAYDPTVRISIGNGPQPLREEFYRAGFPSELFDAAGNEAGVFGRMPERQPPDIVANNASLWMDRQLLDHYGYNDKSIAQCYEITYPSTNPGNLSYGTQAAYFVRHILHSMAWEIPVIRVGSLTDMGNSYYFSNWGASGIFRKLPEVNPKPAAIALGTLTWVLDGAAFERKIDMGSDSLYGLAFTRKDGKRVVAMWTIRGQRPMSLAFTDGSTVTHIDSQANETPIQLVDGKATVTLTGTPVYLVLDGDVKSAVPGKPKYDAAPDGDAVVLDSLALLDGWAINADRNLDLEFYNPMEPRRKGDFRFEAVSEFEDRQNVTKVTPMPIEGGKATMPMYAELVHKQGIELPGQPTELGVWVNGNSSWGRLIFAFEDAKGEQWISLGAPGKSDNRWMADWLPPEMLKKYNPEKQADWNTNDVFGDSRINFDGWRYLAVPLPGQYPGKEYHWAANSQWKFDQDGMVDYPIKLTRIVVQLPEKTLHVKAFAPARRPDIYLADLTVSQGDTVRLKKVAEEYDPSVQMGGL